MIMYKIIFFKSNFSLNNLNCLQLSINIKYTILISNANSYTGEYSIFFKPYSIPILATYSTHLIYYFLSYRYYRPLYTVFVFVFVCVTFLFFNFQIFVY